MTPEWVDRLLARPRDSRLRFWMFQVHLYAGLAVGLIFAVVGLSGSAIVFREELDRTLNPRILHAEAGERRVTADQMISTVLAATPGSRPRGLLLPHEEHDPAVLIVAPPGSNARSDLRHFYLDPVSGRLLGEHGRVEGLLPWVADLRYHLLAGDAGLKVNGVCAALLMAMSISGVVLWWPGRGKTRRALSIQWRARWRRLNWDLHSVWGFWSSVPLALVSFTGVYFAFPLPVIAAVVLLTGGDMQPVKDFFARPRSIPVQGARPVAVEELIRRVEHERPRDKVLYVALPEKPTDSVAVRVFPDGAERTGAFAQIVFDQFSGKVLTRLDSQTAGIGIRTVLFFGPLHFGRFGGLATQLLWVVLGLMPAMLFVSGCLMWWNRAGRRWRVRKAKGSPAPQVELARAGDSGAGF